MNFIKLFVGILIFCFCMDMLWLGLIAKKLYFTQIGALLRTSGGVLQPHWVPAVLVYLLLTIGIIYFALPKAQGSYLLALSWGALFGFVVYGVYDFTNYSILANWSATITVVDVVWGTVLCGLASCFGVFIQRIS